jgi:hypothetical protein
MLKLTYTETGLRLERLSVPLETWVAQRVAMTLCAGQRLFLEPSRASFLLPTKNAQIPRLEELSAVYRASISIAQVDDDCVEVSLKGSWIAENSDAHEGLFITTFSDAVEGCIYRLWHSTQVSASFVV